MTLKSDYTASKENIYVQKSVGLNKETSEDSFRLQYGRSTGRRGPKRAKWNESSN